MHEKTVLVVDDDPGVLLIVGLALTRHGALTVSATNGLEALGLSDSFPGRLDVLVSDIEMPLMNGLDLANRIQARRPGIRILLMSGGNVGETLLPMIRKPFSPSELVSAVSSLLRRRAGRRRDASINPMDVLRPE